MKFEATGSEFSQPSTANHGGTDGDGVASRIEGCPAVEDPDVARLEIPDTGS